MTTPTASTNDDSDDEHILRLLLIGSPSIKLAEVSEASKQEGAHTVRLELNPSSSASQRGSYKSLRAAFPNIDFSIIYSDNDITRYYNSEGDAYFRAVFNLLRPGGVFVCSFLDSCSILARCSELDLTSRLSISEGLELSAVEMVYGANTGTCKAEIFDSRSSLYNGQMIGELATSVGFQNTTVFRIGSAVLVLVAVREGSSHELPVAFRQWVAEALEDL